MKEAMKFLNKNVNSFLKQNSMRRLLYSAILFLFFAQAKSQCWTIIDGGGNFNAGIKTNSSLWTWGNNQFGQLGNGTVTTATSPIHIDSNSTWQSVSAGGSHTMAIKSDGTLWGWGYNFWGQLGDNTSVDKHAPVQIGTANDWMAVACGGNHTIALKTNGTLWSWGANANGQLGNGTANPNQTIMPPTQVGTLNTWTKIAAGGVHSLAIQSGTLWAWGKNASGQLGDGTTADKNVPTLIGTPNQNDWQSISAGESHSLGIKTAGTLWTWGLNAEGELGLGNNSNQNIPTQVLAAATISGFQSSYAPVNWTLSQNNANGTVNTAGAPANIILKTGTNNSGILGTTNYTITVPCSGTITFNWTYSTADFAYNDYPEYQLNGATSVIFPAYNISGASMQNGAFTLTVNAGDVFALIALTEDNDLFPGTITISNFQGPSGCLSWNSIAGGTSHSVMTTTNGKLFTCGNNNYGELGNGTTAAVNTPVQIPSNVSWSKAAAGYYQSHATRADGNAMGWGRNNSGQVGNGTTGSNVLSPLMVTTSGCTPVGLDNMVEHQTMTVYPNPSSNQLQIVLSNNEQIKQLIVSDLSGKIILHQASANKQLDIHSLAGGIYFLQVLTNEGSRTVRFVKE
jgi:alpha-tubulin suppressor-like RCC1 family protein